MVQSVLVLLPLREEERERFRSALPEAEWSFARRSTVTEEQLGRAEVILGAPRPDALAAAGRLRWLQSQWAGVDEYLSPGILPARVAVSRCEGAHDQPVSEHMLAALLSLLRKLPQYRDCQREHAWRDMGQVRSVRDARVLVVGAGRIGTAFARLCRALGAHTVGLKRTVTGPVDGFDELDTMDRLDSQLPLADVTALILPHTPETAGMMDAGRLARMKPGGVLLNAGRGSVLDQDALHRELESGRLWGAALDVFEPEPLPADSPLWDVPNLLITPHVAGGLRLEASRRAAVDVCLDNLCRYAAGQRPTGLVRPGEGVFPPEKNR